MPVNDEDASVLLMIFFGAWLHPSEEQRVPEALERLTHIEIAKRKEPR